MSFSDPIQAISELQRLVHSALHPFHLLLGNIELASHAGVDLARFCRVSSQIQHALLYHSKQIRVPTVPPGERQPAASPGEGSAAPVTPVAGPTVGAASTTGGEARDWVA